MTEPETPAADERTPGQTAGSVRIDVVRGAPTDEELAALIAVVSEEYLQQEDAALAASAPTRSAWEVSARAMGAPPRRDVRWGRFAG